MRSSPLPPVDEVVPGPAVDLGVGVDLVRNQDQVVAAAAVHDDAGDGHGELSESLAVGPDHQVGAGADDVEQVAAVGADDDQLAVDDAGRRPLARRAAGSWP